MPSSFIITAAMLSTIGISIGYTRLSNTIHTKIIPNEFIGSNSNIEPRKSISAIAINNQATKSESTSEIRKARKRPRNHSNGNHRTCSRNGKVLTFHQPRCPIRYENSSGEKNCKALNGQPSRILQIYQNSLK